MASKVGDEGVFHITAGDYYEDGTVTVAAGFYERLVAQFGVDVVWYPTVGNHELEEGGPDMVWLRNFYYDHLEGTVNPGPPNGEETTYSWDYQNAHFVQLNQYYDGTTDDADIDEYTDALYNWLVEDLDRNTKPVVFVIYHEPAYPAGRGGKDSPEGWERLLKLLNDRKVIAGLCADTHTYARYQVDGDWDTFTWEVDAGNAGRLSHGDPWQTFIDVTVSSEGEVQFVTWQGMENEEFTVTDTWTAVALTATLVGPEDGVTVDANGAVLSCEAVPDAGGYQLVFGPDPNHMAFLVSDTADPPTDTVSTFPFEQTWWTMRVSTSKGHTVYAIPRRIVAESVSPQVIENVTTEIRYDYVQDAIDDADPGDEIVMSPGIWQYFGAIDFKGKNLTLRSTDPNDPTVVAATVINGGNRDCVIFSGGEDESCVLTGLTITEANAAIYCTDAAPTITKCRILKNEGAGLRLFGALRRNSATVTSCAIVGNGGTGIESSGLGNHPMIRNCTIAENKVYGANSGDMCRAYITSSIVWGNLEGAIEGSILVGFSDIEGDCLGFENINIDPCFVSPGYWVDADDGSIVVDPNEPNAVWIPGDYHLLPGSPCINTGYWDYPIVPNETDLDGRPRVIGGRIDMGAYEFVPPIEVVMKFTPQALNPGSQGRWVKAHFVLPEEFTVEDVDTNSPARIIEPFRVESEYINVFVNEEDLVEIEAAFGRGAFSPCGSGQAEKTLTVVGLLSSASGQYFRGSDTIKIINKTLEQLAGFASHWLESDCDEPDWCSGFDVDQDSVVNFADFVTLNGCYFEIDKP
jgi:hypothetical protein